MLNIYLAGEIHSDWRDDIIQLTKKNDYRRAVIVAAVIPWSVLKDAEKGNLPKKQ